MTKFFGSFEILKGQKAVIVTLTTSAGAWSGSSRIALKTGSRSALYEAAYRAASTSAALKGGTLERFSEEA